MTPRRAACYGHAVRGRRCLRGSSGPGVTGRSEGARGNRAQRAGARTPTPTQDPDLDSNPDPTASPSTPNPDLGLNPDPTASISTRDPDPSTPTRDAGPSAHLLAAGPRTWFMGQRRPNPCPAGVSFRIDNSLTWLFSAGCRCPKSSPGPAVGIMAQATVCPWVQADPAPGRLCSHPFTSLPAPECSALRLLNPPAFVEKSD